MAEAPVGAGRVRVGGGLIGGFAGRVQPPGRENNAVWKKR